MKCASCTRIFFNSGPGVGEGVASPRGRPELHARLTYNVCRQYFRNTNFAHIKTVSCMTFHFETFVGNISYRDDYNFGLESSDVDCLKVHSNVKFRS